MSMFWRKSSEAVEANLMMFSKISVVPQSYFFIPSISTVKSWHLILCHTSQLGKSYNLVVRSELVLCV